MPVQLTEKKLGKFVVKYWKVEKEHLCKDKTYTVYRKPATNSRFDIVCNLVELLFRLKLSLSRKISGYEAHTISKRQNVGRNI